MPSGPTAEQYIETAKRLYENPDDPISITDTEEGYELIEITEDGLGAYVDAQIWIPVEQVTDDTRKHLQFGRKPKLKLKRIDIVLERPMSEESKDEDTLAVHDLAATFPSSITEVRVLDCDGVFLYHADDREGEGE